MPGSDPRTGCSGLLSPKVPQLTLSIKDSRSQLALRPSLSLRRRSHGVVKGGRFLPGGSEPLTTPWLCLIHNLKGEGPVPESLAEFFRGLVRKRAVRALLVVIAAPLIQLAPRVGQVEKDLSIQAFVAQSAVEAFNVTILNRPSRPDEVELHSSLMRPYIHRLACEFAAVIGGNRLRHAAHVIRRFICSTTFSPVWERSAYAHRHSRVY